MSILARMMGILNFRGVSFVFFGEDVSDGYAVFSGFWRIWCLAVVVVIVWFFGCKISWTFHFWVCHIVRPF